jgi:signal transduction histidine kinase
VVECRQIVDDVVDIVRDLALGLRPAMLDDLGLGPALEWLVRDYSRRFKLRIELHTTNSLEGLNDQQKTCIYRVVQKGLTNCVRHSRATCIWVALHADHEHVHLSIRDDGIGLDPTRRFRGFGLRGIEERVRERGGSASLLSAVGGGATLSVRLPADVEATDQASGRFWKDESPLTK